jgi:hypothetical protein
MRTPLIALALLLTTSIGWANSPPPARIDKVVILEFPDDEVEWSYEVERTSKPIVLGRDRTFRIQTPHGITLDYPYTHRVELSATDRSGRVRKSEPIDTHWEETTASYGQKEIRYRVELTPTDIRVHKIGERMLASTNEMVVWALVVSSVIVLAGWLASVWWRRRKLTRTARPPT